MSKKLDILYILFALLLSPLLIYTLIKTGKWRTDWSCKFGKCIVTDKPQGKKRLLIHAVSVGEVNATTAMIHQLLEQNQASLQIVLSVTTNTGYDRAKQLYHGKIQIIRYPFDLSFCVKKYLNRLKPDAVALMELELWPNFVQACEKRKIPIVIANARLSPNSFKGYRKLRFFLNKTFSKITHVCAQTPQYAQRFEYMGTDPKKITIVDSMKWDTATIAKPRQTSAQSDLAKALGIDPKRKVIVAGSTGPREEQIIISASPPNAQIIIVPRKPEHFEQVAQQYPNIIRRSQHPDNTTRNCSPDQQLFLLDTMGQLAQAYALADLCIVGRSFVKMEGSDPIQPIALGKATIIGPNHSAFSQVVAAFQKQNAIIVSQNLKKDIANLLENPQQATAMAKRGVQVIQAKRGATQRNIDCLLKILNQINPGKSS